jgi:type II secretory pathway component PulJ
MPAMTSTSSHTGATLVEVLVALGIGVMITAVVILAHHALTQQAGRQLDRQRIDERADRTINELRLDLQQLFLPLDDDTGTVSLENSATNLVSLSFLRRARLTSEAALSTSRLERVTYRFEQFGEKTELIRTVAAVTGPDAELPAATNRLGQSWPQIFIHLHDGEAWRTNWPFAGMEDDKADPPRPRAARIQLLGDGAPVHETLVVIPSGLSVTSTVLRAGR